MVGDQVRVCQHLKIQKTGLINWFEFWDAGGALVGIIMGAINGQTTETGLVRGSFVGAITGAITALQLMDMMANGEPFSKVFTHTCLFFLMKFVR